MYENEKEVSKIQETIKEISPDLVITTHGLDGNRIILVGVMIPLKGGADKISALKELGWECTWRERIYNASHSAFIIVQNMVYRLGCPGGDKSVVA